MSENWSASLVAESYFGHFQCDYQHSHNACLNIPKIKDFRVHAPVTWIKLGIPIYFIDHAEFITGQCKKILSRANKNETKCFDFGSIKTALKPHLRTIIAG